MSNTTQVAVFHNVGNVFDEHRHGDKVVQVFATTVEEGRDPFAVCEEMYELLNIGHEPYFQKPDPRAVAYRVRGNRGMSVGDVVRVDCTWYACAGTGFTVLELEPAIVTSVTRPLCAQSSPSTPYLGVDVLPEPQPDAGAVPA